MKKKPHSCTDISRSTVDLTKTTTDSSKEAIKITTNELIKNQIDDYKCDFLLVVSNSN